MQVPRRLLEYPEHLGSQVVRLIGFLLVFASQK